ncbi:MAG: MFS transporter [Candidatus Saccharimonadales bacterium]
MFQKLFKRFIRRRHYWREVSFDELTELYTSMMFRSLAIGLVGIFIPIYLYQHGSPVWEILFFYMTVYTAHVIFSIVSAFVIARIGPKHTILLSYVFLAISMIGLISLYRLNLPLYTIAISFGIANALFFTAFHTDFSKIKHTEHGGKEVGWMYIMQKVGTIIGPILGGIIAYFFGSQYIFMVALGMLCVGILPLLFTAEPVKTKQKLDFRHLTVKSIKFDLISYSAFSLETSITMVVWPLFIGVLVFRDNPYIQLGSVASISIIASLLIARAIGGLIDNRQGRQLLRFGAILNAVLHLFRPFTGGYSSALAVNIANEGVTIAYTMPYTKGLYDAADDHPGHRIVYICTLETAGAATRVLFYGLASMAAMFYDDGRGLFFGLFAVGALASLVIMKERFRALDV